MQRLETNHQLIAKKYFINYFLPIMMIGWMGSSVKYLKVIFTENTRWLFLATMLVFICTKPKLFKFIDARLALMITLYSAWCFFTSFWSTIPLLSFMKSGIYILLIPTFIFIGLEWVRRNSDDNVLNYLWLFSFITIFSSFLGEHSLDQKEYYRGLATGSNMLGFMLASSAPYCFWKAYLTFKQKIFYLYAFLSLCCVYFVFLSMSRSAILMVILIMLSMLVNLNLNKKLMMLISSIIIGVGIIAFNPSIINNVATNANGYIFKGQDTLFNSRMNAWNLSSEGAKEGGWTGLGFGVAYGNYDFNLGDRLTSVNYGREKGNSQLAIIEETGLIGLILYIFLLLSVIIKFLIMRFNSQTRNQQVLTGILAGTFLGMIVLSFFEAWWLSPGAPESIYFWVLIGIISGFEIDIYNKRINKRMNHVQS